MPELIPVPEKIKYAKRVYYEMRTVLAPRDLADVVAVAGQVKKGSVLDLPAETAFEFRSASTGLGLRVREHALGGGKVRFLLTASPMVSESFLDNLYEDSDRISGTLSDIKQLVAKQGPDSGDFKQAVSWLEEWKRKKRFDERISLFTGLSMHEAPNALAARDKKRVSRQIAFIAENFKELHDRLKGKPPKVSKYAN